MKKLLLILLCLPMIGFGQINIAYKNGFGTYTDTLKALGGTSIQQNVIVRKTCDDDIIPNSYVESYWLHYSPLGVFETISESPSESMCYYTNYRPKVISWRMMDYPCFVQTEVLFHSNGKIKSIEVYSGAERNIDAEMRDSAFFNLDGSDKIKNQSRFYNGKEKYEILGNHLFNMSHLDSLSNIEAQKLIVIYELDKLLNKYYKVLKRDMQDKRSITKVIYHQNLEESLLQPIWDEVYRPSDVPSKQVLKQRGLSDSVIKQGLDFKYSRGEFQTSTSDTYRNAYIALTGDTLVLDTTGWKYNSNSFRELKKSQEKWLKKRGDLITTDNKDANDVGKINDQIKLYQNRLYWLRNQMTLYFHKKHINFHQEDMICW